MGVTLEHLQIHTTDKDWNPHFVDRVDKSHNQGICETELYKLLKIKSLGFYHIPNDTFFISEFAPEK